MHCWTNTERIGQALAMVDASMMDEAGALKKWRTLWLEVLLKSPIANSHFGKAALCLSLDMLLKHHNQTLGTSAGPAPRQALS
jgi:hypothetical protein